MSERDDSNRARDHLANERTFLAWLRTGIAIVVFGFAIGRFSIAIREFAQAQGHATRTPDASVWFGTIAMIAGVVLTLAGLARYRKTRAELDTGSFEPAGYVVTLVAVLTAAFGLVLAAYLIWIGVRL